jgi:hypothetical protein
MNQEKNIEYIYHTIPLEKRPKLYKQLIDNPYNLSPLNLDELFIYLITKKKNGELLFKLYVEFLNIFNTLVLFYSICFYIHIPNQNDKFILLIVDIPILFTAVGYYILINGKQGKQNTKNIIILGYAVLVVSKYFSNEIHFKKQNIFYSYIKLYFLIFSLFFLFSFDYFINIYYSSTNFTKIFYMILIFIMSFLYETIFMKIRIIIFGIHFFEFFPEIRKFYQSFSDKTCYISYVLFSLYFTVIMFYIKELNELFIISVLNILIIVFYPKIFNYYYKKEKW